MRTFVFRNQDPLALLLSVFVYFFIDSHFRKCFKISKKKYTHVNSCRSLGRKSGKSMSSTQPKWTLGTIHTGCGWLIKIHVVAYYISEIAFYYEFIVWMENILAILLRRCVQSNKLKHKLEHNNKHTHTHMHKCTSPISLSRRRSMSAQNIVISCSIKTVCRVMQCMCCYYCAVSFNIIVILVLCTYVAA